MLACMQNVCGSAYFRLATTMMIQISAWYICDIMHTDVDFMYREDSSRLQLNNHYAAIICIAFKDQNYPSFSKISETN